MDTYLLIIIICLILSGIFKSIMDLLIFGKPNIFVKESNKWFNYTYKTSKNKYKYGNKACGEKFPGSTTIFVFVTDAWHFFQMLNNVCLSVPFAIILHINFLIYVVDMPKFLSFGICLFCTNAFKNFIFELFYSKFFKSK